MRGRGRKRWRRRIAEGELVADVDDGMPIHQGSRGFPFCGLLEVSWCQAGVLLGSFWGLLEPCLGTPLTFSFGSLGGPPGAILDRVGHGWAPDSPLLEFKDRLLGLSWDALGLLLGALGAVLERSWAPLRAFAGHLGTIWRLQRSIASESAIMHTTVKHNTCLADLPLLAASFRCSVAT